MDSTKFIHYFNEEESSLSKNHDKLNKKRIYMGNFICNQGNGKWDHHKISDSCVLIE